MIVAPERATAARDLPAAVSTRSADAPDCPFCPGTSTRRRRRWPALGGGEADTRAGTVRVVPNLYPIVGDAVAGAHEVIVLSPAPRPVARPPLRPTPRADGAPRSAIAPPSTSRAGLAHAVPFVNHGKPAGASIEHPHAQLVALDFVPPAVSDDLARFERSGRDLVADALSTAADRSSQ